MSNDRRDAKQLTLNFDAKDMNLRANGASFGLSLVVDNSATARPAPTCLEPNSPEITQIIRSLGKSLTW